MAKLRKQDALDYHSQGRPGKIEVVPTKPHSSQRDLSLAYSPGVAEPCLEIEKNPEDAYKQTFFYGKGCEKCREIQPQSGGRSIAVQEA